MSKRSYVLFTLLVNGILPWGLYVWLSHYITNLAALTIATLVPLIDNVFHLAKHRKLDAFGGLMLTTFLLTIVLVLLGGNEKLILVRESFITASVGLIFIISLLFRQPIMFHLAMRFVGNADFESNWKYDYFRYVMRLMTFVWGAILLSEASVRMILVFQLSTAQFLAVSNFVMYGFIGIAILWTVAYRKRSSRRLADIKLRSQIS